MSRSRYFFNGYLSLHFALSEYFSNLDVLVFYASKETFFYLIWKIQALNKLNKYSSGTALYFYLTLKFLIKEVSTS